MEQKQQQQLRQHVSQFQTLPHFKNPFLTSKLGWWTLPWRTLVYSRISSVMDGAGAVDRSLSEKTLEEMETAGRLTRRGPAMDTTLTTDSNCTMEISSLQSRHQIWQCRYPRLKTGSFRFRLSEQFRFKSTSSQSRERNPHCTNGHPHDNQLLETRSRTWYRNLVYTAIINQRSWRKG